MSFSPRSYLFTSATVRTGVYTTPIKEWHKIRPIQYVTLGFRDRRSEACLRLRNRSEMPYLHGMMFRGDAKDIRDSNVNIALIGAKSVINVYPGA